MTVIPAGVSAEPAHATALSETGLLADLLVRDQSLIEPRTGMLTGKAALACGQCAGMSPEQSQTAG